MTHDLTDGWNILDYDCPRKKSYRWQRCRTQPLTCCDSRSMDKMPCPPPKFHSHLPHSAYFAIRDLFLCPMEASRYFRLSYSNGNTSRDKISNTSSFRFGGLGLKVKVCRTKKPVGRSDEKSKLHLELASSTRVASQCHK